MSLSLQDLGWFPSARRPRVLWIGIGGEIQRLTDLRARVITAATPFSPVPSEAHYTPHLTLARIRNPHCRETAMISQKAAMLKANLLGSWEATTLELYRSTLRSTGSQYEILAQLPLGSSITPVREGEDLSISAQGDDSNER